MTARRYQQTWAPFLKRVWKIRPQTMAILRHPRTRLESWYRYRLTAGGAQSTSGMSFDAFVREVLSDSPAEPARIGAQDQFACDPDGNVLIDHLFVLEQPGPLMAFLAERFGKEIEPETRNISPDADVNLTQDTEKLLNQRRASEFALYHRVAKTGHLRLT